MKHNDVLEALEKSARVIAAFERCRLRPYTRNSLVAWVWALACDVRSLAKENLELRARLVELGENIRD